MANSWKELQKAHNPKRWPDGYGIYGPKKNALLREAKKEALK